MAVTEGARPKGVDSREHSGRISTIGAAADKQKPMTWDVLPFAFFAAVGVVHLVWVPRLWKMDVDALERRVPPSSLLRRSVAVSPGGLVWCWMVTMAGVLIVLDDRWLPLPRALRVALGLLWFGVTLVVLTAAYYGRPRWALLPVLRSPSNYARFMRSTST